MEITARLNTTEDHDLQTAFDHWPLATILFDPQLHIRRCNLAADFLVREHDNLATALTAGSQDSRGTDWTSTLKQVLSEGRSQRFEQLAWRDVDGRTLSLNLQCIPLPDEHRGETNVGMLLVEDVTNTASLEKRLAVSERMAAIGKLSARVAHELNNPLDGILRYLNLALRVAEIGPPEKLTRYLEQARTGILRMTEIVRELVEYSRGSHASSEDTSINAIVDEAVRVMSERAAANGVSMVCSLQADMPTIQGTALFQVFCNLIKNAIDAMPTGGTLTIVTAMVNGEAVIRFEDTGIGLPPEMERIFEPFFTTKEPGKGTGLGLAICKDIIDRYHGQITPRRRDSGGTIFQVRIPIRGES